MLAAFFLGVVGCAADVVDEPAPFPEDECFEEHATWEECDEAKERSECFVLFEGTSTDYTFRGCMDVDTRCSTDVECHPEQECRTFTTPTCHVPAPCASDSTMEVSYCWPPVKE